MFNKLFSKLKTPKVPKFSFNQHNFAFSNLAFRESIKQIRMPAFDLSRFSHAFNTQLAFLQSVRLANPNLSKTLFTHGQRLRQFFNLKTIAKSFALSVALYVAYEYNPYMTGIRLYYVPNEFNNALVSSLKHLYNTHFYPSLICTTPLLQAIMNTSQPGAAVAYSREPLPLPDGGQVTLDWALPTKEVNLAGTILHGRKYPYQPSKDNKIMLILHGLTGGSECNYIQVLVNAAREKGYRVVVMNQRGINQPLKTLKTFHGGNLNDLYFALDHIKKNYPDAPIMAIGTSFGANQLVRYLGEVGDKAKILGAVALAAPFDIDACVDDIENTVYEEFFVKTYFEKNFLPNMDIFLPLVESHGINLEEVAKVKSLRDFHTLFTVKVYEHKDVREYFSYSKIHDSHINNIKIPLLVLNAKDDPIAVRRCVPFDTLSQNPNIITAETSRGGHLCWFTGVRPKRWYANPTVEFTEKILEFKQKDNKAALSQ